MAEDHLKGFDNERKFNQVFQQARIDNPSLKVHTIKRVIAHFAPYFTDCLFERRECHRKLKYVGTWYDDSESIHQEEYFQVGETYESETFNGGTYSFRLPNGGQERIIGCAYFEWVS